MNSKLRSCDDCGGKVSKRAATCPHCGAPLDPVVESEEEISAEHQEPIDLRQQDEVEQMNKGTTPQREVPLEQMPPSMSSNLIICGACGAKRSGRHWTLETFCPACGDKRESIESFWMRPGCLLLTILILSPFFFWYLELLSEL